TIASILPRPVQNSIHLSPLFRPSISHLSPFSAIYRSTPRFCLTFGEGDDRNGRPRFALGAAPLSLSTSLHQFFYQLPVNMSDSNYHFIIRRLVREKPEGGIDVGQPFNINAIKHYRKLLYSFATSHDH
ncbi:hypothetical protein A2U01_0045151, partial [Trifolium medium]|nr:hypothetical protein [Trifolium medium]